MVAWKPTLVIAAAVATVAFAGTTAGISEQQGRFPDAAMAPVTGWTGPIFRLSQDYPTSRPAAENYPWLQHDFRTDPTQYARAVLNYCVEGNDAVDWEVQRNAVRRWYHTPWLHWGRNGREFIHGLTHERVSEPYELSPNQSSRFQNWAVGIYNAPGGHVIGQVWRDPEQPDPDAAEFPEGTVSCKLLFTQASLDQVPYLRGSKEWDGFIYREIATPTNPRMPRVVQKLRLLQIDIAVRDSRADATTGWVFGTFIYNADASGMTVWEKMVPVGLMWGNDPGVTAAMVNAGARLQETAINHSDQLPLHTVQAPRQHLGWAGRLNGPVDNPMSSCISCHSTAQWPALSPMTPAGRVVPGSFDWMRWFRNIQAGQSFDPGAKSLDYSLQLAAGIQNFTEWKDLVSSRGGVSNRAMPGAPSNLMAPLHGLPAPSNAQTPRRRVFEVSRDEKNVVPLDSVEP